MGYPPRKGGYPPDRGYPGPNRPQLGGKSEDTPPQGGLPLGGGTQSGTPQALKYPDFLDQCRIKVYKEMKK